MERLEGFGRAVLSAVDALDTAPDIPQATQSGLLLQQQDDARLGAAAARVDAAAAGAHRRARRARPRAPPARAGRALDPVGAQLRAAVPQLRRARVRARLARGPRRDAGCARASGCAAVRRLGSDRGGRGRADVRADVAVVGRFDAPAGLGCATRPRRWRRWRWRWCCSRSACSRGSAIPSPRCWRCRRCTCGWCCGSPQRWDIGPLSRRLVSFAVVALGLLPLAALVAFYAHQLGLGFGEVAWTGVLLLAAGQVGLGGAILWSLALGCAAAAAMIALAPRHVLAETRETAPFDVTIRGPLSYAGPGSLGGTESALRR